MIQKRYEGYLKTPLLWENKTVFGLEPFKINSESHQLNLNLDESLRLGNYVERFVSFELKQQERISIIAENIQIQDEKITIGEIDCLLFKDNKPIHLEIIYKFYLYDDTVGTTEVDHFIGPNRKDSLKEKLTKLKDKQLPLLYHKSTQSYLNGFRVNPNTTTQQVYFKAQLFLPFTNQNIILETLNLACVAGFYLNLRQLIALKDCKFYIPIKKDWLIIAHHNVNWLLFDDFLARVKPYLLRQFSPLCWVKFNNGEIKKMFLVWW